MSLLGLPIPVPGLYAKNNLKDGLRHTADCEENRMDAAGTVFWFEAFSCLIKGFHEI